MIIVNILRDGTIFPPLKQDGLIVKLFNGRLQIGRYNKALYVNESHAYIVEPLNATELKNELMFRINTEMPELFSKRYVVHFICPKNIADKVEWISSEMMN